LVKLRFARLFGIDGKLSAQLSRRYLATALASESVAPDPPGTSASAQTARCGAPASEDSNPCYSYPMEDASGEPAGELSLILDTREFEETRVALTRRIDFERLITQLSTQFIEIDEPGIDDDIEQALGSIGQFASVDRAYVFLFSSDGKTMVNTHEWCAPGITPEKENLQALPVEVYPWWTQRLKQREVIHVPRVELLGEEAAAEKAILSEQSIRSVVVVPLVYAKKVTGFLGFDSVRAEKAWPPDDIALLKIVGEMLMNALERQRAHAVHRSLEEQIIAARSLQNVAKLAGGVAHDFNNLLGVILNCATAISRKLTDPSLSSYADDLITAANQATELTRQLLIVGRCGIVEPTVLDPNHILRTLENLLQRTLGENVRLELRLAEPIERIRIARAQFEQVIVNLAMNARDAMPAGGRFTVTTRSVVLDAAEALKRIDVEPGRYVLLVADDTGTGMTPEVLSHAFEPFFTTKRPRGTGLGLSTVHSIVTQSGGHVTLTSNPGLGTRADIYFPAIEDERPVVPSTPPEPKHVSGRGETVLVVEDCDSLRRLICDALKNDQYRVIEAADASQALELCAQRAQGVDLLLADVIMPEVSGRALADRMAEQGSARRIAYMSGYDDTVLSRYGVLEAGIHLIQKPFLTDELLRFVRRVLDSA